MSGGRFLPTPDDPDNDPFLWLEEREAPAALAWAGAQTAATVAALGDHRFETDRAALKAIMDSPGKPLRLTRAGGRVFNFWQDGAHPRGIWRTATMESIAGADTAWDVLLDLDRLAAAEGEDWAWAGASILPGTHDRAIISLSRGGRDAVVMREFDLDARAFAADGFRLPEAKGGEPAWLDRDTLLLTSALGDGMANPSGYARTVRLWRRGTDGVAAPVIFETSAPSYGIYAYAEHDGARERVWFYEGTYRNAVVVRVGDRGGPQRRLDLPPDAVPAPGGMRHGDWLAVTLRSPWTAGGVDLAADTVIGISLPAFLAGGRHFTVLFEPGPRRVVTDSFWCGGHLYLFILDDLRTVVEVLTPAEDRTWTRRPLPGVPEIGTADGVPLDDRMEESNGDVLVRFSGPLIPPSVMLLNPAAPPRLIRRSPAVFDTAGLTVSRHEAVSVDGIPIPYVQVGPDGEPAGDAPVLLTGYGGFGIPNLADYHAGWGKLWLERGGTLVVAAIRGGGEFGGSWHKAGQRAGKRLSHDDFAAVAADLAARGVTRPGRIAAEGGSNGGLLVTNMLTRYPERFGAVLCEVPVIDMRGLKRLGGTAWTDEYGDPDEPEDWAFLAGLSPYHTAEPGRPYPPILVVTNRADDRVHCGHGRKLVAKLQAMGYAARLFEPAAGGHAGGDTADEVAVRVALGCRFLRDALGWEPVENGEERAS